MLGDLQFAECTRRDDDEGFTIQKISVIGSIIKTSLAMVIPILFIGSITVLLNGFPVQAYQDFLDSFWGGALRKLIQIIQSTTVGNLAIYMTVALNLCYMNQAEEGQRLAFKFGRSSWFYAFPKI